MEGHGSGEVRPPSAPYAPGEQGGYNRACPTPAQVPAPVRPGLTSPHNRCLRTKCHSVILIALPGRGSGVWAPSTRAAEQAAPAKVFSACIGAGGYRHCGEHAHTRTRARTHTVIEAHSLGAFTQRTGPSKAGLPEKLSGIVKTLENNQTVFHE